MSEDAKAVVRQFIDTLNAGAFDQRADLLHPDLTYTLQGIDFPGAGRKNREGVLSVFDNVLGLVAEGSPQLEITAMSSDGPWVILEAEGSGTSRDGTACENHYVHVYGTADGQIRTHREHFDTQHMAALMAKVAGQ